MRKTKAQKLQEARNMLLQLANEDISFVPHASVGYLMAVKKIDGINHPLFYRHPQAMVTPKWDSPAHFWGFHSRAEFDQVYQWGVAPR